MKAAILLTTFVLGGETSIALSWWRTLRAAGVEADLFAWSSSGKYLQSFRKDVKPKAVFALGRPAGIASAKEILKGYDVFLMSSLGVFGETPGAPGPYKHLLETGVPTFGYIGSIFTFSFYKNSRQIIEHPSFKGFIFMRQELRDFYLRMPDDPFASKNCITVASPVDVSNRKRVILPEGQPRKFIAAARVSPSKHTKEIVSAFNNMNLEETCGARFEVWGDTSMSRYSFFIREEFPDFWEKHYRGPYDERTIDRIYDGTSYAIDLSNYKGDAGIHGCHFEAFVNGAVPITPHGWVPDEASIHVESKDDVGIGTAIYEACSLSEVERQQKLLNGVNYLREFHDPTKQAQKLLEFIRGSM